MKGRCSEDLYSAYCSKMIRRALVWWMQENPERKRACSMSIKLRRCSVLRFSSYYLCDGMDGLHRDPNLTFNSCGPNAVNIISFKGAFLSGCRMKSSGAKLELQKDWWSRRCVLPGALECTISMDCVLQRCSGQWTPSKSDWLSTLKVYSSRPSHWHVWKQQSHFFQLPNIP